MDVSTQTAVCFLGSPLGVSSLNPYPCKLFWQSESDLLIGWADNFRHLELIHTTHSAPAGSEGTAEVSELFAKTVSDWQADVIICGLSTFDENHVVLLGYVPPALDSGDNDGGEGDFPEIQIVDRATGELVSVDALPLIGKMARGPWSYHLVSNYSCFSRRRDFHRWNMCQSFAARGGNRGLSPTCFLSSGQDFITVRVRDINDRVHAALELGDLKSAVCLAFSDRTSLRQYQLHDLMTIYLDDLLDKGRADIAAEECKALIGKDAILWERWILAFVARKQTQFIVPCIPISLPRLPSSVYEVVLEDLLQGDAKMFLQTVKSWAKIQPRLFDHDMLLLRLETVHSPDKFILEAEAELYVVAKQYEKAIHAYLEIEGERCKDARSSSSIAQKSSTAKVIDESRDFSHIFDLIERQDLFNSVRDKLVNMFRLSRAHTEEFLLRNIDKLPVKVVVRQLKIDRRCLCWYLHLIFTNCFETYNTEEFADFHIMQVSLYAEFSQQAMRPLASIDVYASDSSSAIISGYELVKVRRCFSRILFFTSSLALSCAF